jgi:hypothetical protein
MGYALRKDVDTAGNRDALDTTRNSAEAKYAVILSSDLEDKLVGWGFDLDSAVRFAQSVSQRKDR